MENSSKNVPCADDLDSTVLRHQVQRYFNELNQEEMGNSPLNMEFLSMKRKPTVSTASSSLRTSAYDSLLPKKIRFDATGENSFTGDFSLHSMPKRNTDSMAQSLKGAKIDVTSQLEQKLAEKQASILELQQKIIQIEMKLNESLTEKDQLKYDLSNIQDVCKTKVRHYEDKIEDLQIEIKQLHLKIDQLSKENQSKKEAMEQLKLGFSEEKLTFSKQSALIEQKLVEMELEHESQIRELKKKLENVTWESNKNKLEAEEAQNQLKLKERVVVPCNHESVIEQQRQVILEMENALFTQRTLSSQSQEAKLAKIPQLEKELLQLQQTNKLYKETVENELLLKEQISTLQKSLQRYKEQCQTIPNLEVELKKVTSHLQEWEFMAERYFYGNSIAQVQLQVEDMRKKELKLVDDLGSLQVEVNSLNRSNSMLRDQISSLKDVAQAKTDLEERVRKLERKLIVVQKDRDHYRTVNEMYESEMTRVGVPGLVSMEAKQIIELERLLEEYRTLVSATGATPSVNSDDIAKLNEEKEVLAKEVAQLTQTVKNLKGQLEEAQSKGVVSSDTRILHFTSNPLDNARKRTLDQLSQLEKENESLRERVRLMEAGHSQNLTLMVGDHFDQGCTPERLKDLEEKLKSSELKNQRVEEVFRKYCSDFRRGVFELFGYQVDNDECGNFKLISVFSDTSSDYLSFKYVGDGLMVMDSPYVHTIDDLVQLHIVNQKSIPVFLASLTIELFSRQSINSSAYPSVMETPS